MQEVLKKKQLLVGFIAQEVLKEGHLEVIAQEFNSLFSL